MSAVFLPALTKHSTYRLFRDYRPPWRPAYKRPNRTAA
jgi:hypothetical protein